MADRRPNEPRPVSYVKLPEGLLFMLSDGTTEYIPNVAPTRRRYAFNGEIDKRLFSDLNHT